MEEGSTRYIEQEISFLKDRIHRFHLGIDPSLSREGFLQDGARLEYLLDNNELRWKQRGKVDWLKNGDRNTSFFHAKAAARRRANRIDRLLNWDGIWCQSAKEMEDVIQGFFYGSI